MNAMIKHIEENMQRDIEILIKDNKRRQENVSNAIAHLKCHINYYMYKTADLESQHRHDEILTTVCDKFNILSVDRHYISKELLKFRVLRIQHVLAILLILSIIFCISFYYYIGGRETVLVVIASTIFTLIVSLIYSTTNYISFRKTPRVDEIQGYDM